MRISFRFPFLFTNASAGEEVHEVVVVFVASVLIHLFFRIDLSPWNPGGPRAAPRGWIRNCEFVIQRVGVDAGEALDDLKSLRVGVLKDDAIVRAEVSGFYHQRAALP